MGRMEWPLPEREKAVGGKGLEKKIRNSNLGHAASEMPIRYQLDSWARQLRQEFGVHQHISDIQSHDI